VEIYNVGRAGVFLFLKRAADLFSAPGKTISVREMQIPGKARDALHKGIERLHEKQDYKGSLNFFQRAVAQYPGYYQAYYEIGLAYLRLNQLTESEQALRKSIELSQGHYAEAYFLLASILSNKQEFAEAQTLARQGLELDGNAWQGYFEMARALFGQNQFETAEKNALQARMRKPDFPLTHLLLANLHLRKRDYPSLLEDLDTYLKLEPNGTMSEQARGMRDKVQQALTNASAPASPPPKP
jgi:tetratricopeptide (TPR) repeat protein